jgi:hypothetical protein
MSVIQDFRKITDTAMEDLDKLLATTSLKEYMAVMEAVAPNLRAWLTRYEELGRTISDQTTRTQIAEIGEQYETLLKKAFAHQSSLKLEPQPLEGGRKWKMPRKMTRRYCKKTSCRKMGFTQKASCRPWKNCY